MSPPTQRAGWHTPAAVLAVTVLWLVCTAWLRPLMLPDEGRYVGVAWEMLRSGDWRTPTLDGLPFFHKPPLFYWLTAGALRLFGPHELAARVAPLLGAVLGAFALYLFLRRWAGERLARLALAALLAQPLFFVGGQFANLDMLVAGCITVCTLLLAHACLCAEHRLPHRSALLGAYAAAGLGLLAKGLIGFVIPALVLLAWLALRRRLVLVLQLLWWPAVLLMLLIAVPWFAMVQWRFPQFLDYFFVVQHFKRFAAGGFNNQLPVWFYGALLLAVSLPWLPWLWRARPGSGQRIDGHTSATAVQQLLWLWLAVVLVFFSLPQSKLVGYVLPAMPPLAGLIALGLLQGGEPAARSRRLWWAGTGVAALVGVAAVLVLAQRTQDSLRPLGRHLLAQRAANEPLLMLDRYYYDLVFYARLAAPVPIVHDWDDPDIALRDSWRKELADAGRFDPARAGRLLLLPAALPAALCTARVSWLVGPQAAPQAYPFLHLVPVAGAVRNTRLWRIDAGSPALAAALGCAGTPNGGSAGK